MRLRATRKPAASTDTPHLPLSGRTGGVPRSTCAPKRRPRSGSQAEQVPGLGGEPSAHCARLASPRGPLAPSPARDAPACATPLPHLEPPARSLTSRRSLLFRRHRRNHPAGSATPGLAASRAPGPPCAGPGGGPGAGTRAPGKLCRASGGPPQRPLGAQPAPTRSPAGRDCGASGLGLACRGAPSRRQGPGAGRSHGGTAPDPCGWRHSAERLARQHLEPFWKPGFKNRFPRSL